jgi:hypothetical protein
MEQGTIQFWRRKDFGTNFTNLHEMKACKAERKPSVAAPQTIFWTAAGSEAPRRFWT